MSEPFSIEIAVSILEDFPMTSVCSVILRQLRKIGRAGSGEEAIQLRNGCLEYLKNEIYAQTYDNHNNFSVQYAIYYTLIVLANLYPINTQDPITLEVIDSKNLVLLSSGYQFDIENFIRSHIERSIQDCDNEVPGRREKVLSNPWTKSDVGFLDTQFVWYMAAFRGLDIPQLDARLHLSLFSNLPKSYQKVLRLPQVKESIEQGLIPIGRLQKINVFINKLGAYLDQPISGEFVRHLLQIPKFIEHIVLGKINVDAILKDVQYMLDIFAKITCPFAVKLAQEKFFQGLDISQAIIEGNFPIDQLHSIEMINDMLATYDAIDEKLKEISHPLVIRLLGRVLFLELGRFQNIEGEKSLLMTQLDYFVNLDSILLTSIDKCDPDFIQQVVIFYNTKLNEFKSLLLQDDFEELQQIMRGLLRAYGLESRSVANIPESLRDYTAPEAISDLAVYVSYNVRSGLNVYYFLFGQFIDQLINIGNITPDSWRKLSQETFEGIFSRSYGRWFPLIEKLLLEKAGQSAVVVRDENHYKAARACFIVLCQQLPWDTVVSDIINTNRELMIGFILALRPDLSTYINTPQLLLNTILQFSGWIHDDFIRDERVLNEQRRKDWTQTEEHDVWLRNSEVNHSERLLESLNMVLDACITNNDQFFAILQATYKSKYDPEQKQKFTQLILKNYLCSVDRLLEVFNGLEGREQIVALLRSSNVSSFLFRRVITNVDELIRVVNSLASHEVTKSLLVDIINQSLGFREIKLLNNDDLVRVVGALQNYPKLAAQIVNACSKSLLAIILTKKVPEQEACSNLTLCVGALKAFYGAKINVQALLAEIKKNLGRITVGADVDMIIEFLEEIKPNFPFYGCELMEELCKKSPRVLQSATSEQLIQLVELFHSSARDERYWNSIQQIMRINQPHLGEGATIKTAEQLIRFIDVLRSCISMDSRALAEIYSIFSPAAALDKLNMHDGFTIQSVDDLVKIINLLREIDGAKLVQTFINNVDWSLIPVAEAEKKPEGSLGRLVQDLRGSGDKGLKSVAVTLNNELINRTVSSLPTPAKRRLITRLFGRGRSRDLSKSVDGGQEMVEIGKGRKH